ncbi:MAG TPA: glutaredoxin domain-containing protein [Candidatus Lokiarchaeia archaeon]|nr:glutaredoxin domain-containing protein [Candidatus Lokiarchaeia archaeon]
MRIAVITKPACSRCAALKAYLNEKNVEYEELDVESPQVQQDLLSDPNFVGNYCEEDGCTVHTPLVYDFEQQKYYSKELFGQNGLRKKVVNKLLLIV